MRASCVSAPCWAATPCSVWFWDYSSLNSLRTLPYLLEWHRRYGDSGLRILGVHSRLSSSSGAIPSTSPRRPHVSGSSSQSPTTPNTRCGANTATRSGLRSTSGTAGACSAITTSPRAPTRRPSGRSGSCCSRSTMSSRCRIPLRRCARPTFQAHRSSCPPRTGISKRIARVAQSARARSFRSGTPAPRPPPVLDGQGTAEASIDGQEVCRLELDGPRLYELYETPGHEQHLLTIRFEAPATAYMFSFAPGPAST